jgi:hypothetical protein
LKLETSVAPRKEGCVRFSIEDRLYVFRPDAQGALIGEVDLHQDIKFLLDTGNFSPVIAEDFESAIQIQSIKKSRAAPSAKTKE